MFSLLNCYHNNRQNFIKCLERPKVNQTATDSTVEAETSRRQESFKRKARSNFGCFCLALALFKRFVYFMCIGVMPVCMSI